MKKNHNLHVSLEEYLKDKLRLEADKQGISMSEFGRTSIREKLNLIKIENSQLTKLENSQVSEIKKLLEKVLKQQLRQAARLEKLIYKIAEAINLKIA